MVCGCKKTFCTARICKCKKADVACTDACTCGDGCQNKKVLQNHKKDEDRNGMAGPSVPESHHHNWEDVFKLCREEENLIEAVMSKLHIMSPLIQQQTVGLLLEKKKAHIENMKKLLLKQGSELQAKEILTAEEWETFCNKLTPCNICGRKFNPDRIAKHQKICLRRSNLYQPAA